MDRKLLDILCCPASRQPLSLLDSNRLEALNRAIANGSVKRIDDVPQTSAVREALLTRDGKLIYRVEDGIPVLLSEEAIATTQIDNFPGN